jgi:hypothetical protein
LTRFCKTDLPQGGGSGGLPPTARRVPDFAAGGEFRWTPSDSPTIGASPHAGRRGGSGGLPPTTPPLALFRPRRTHVTRPRYFRHTLAMFHVCLSQLASLGRPHQVCRLTQPFRAGTFTSASRSSSRRFWSPLARPGSATFWGRSSGPSSSRSTPRRSSWG